MIQQPCLITVLLALVFFISAFG